MNFWARGTALNRLKNAGGPDRASGDCTSGWTGSPTGESRIRQISPQVAEQPVAVCPSGIEAFSAEHPEENFVARRIEHVPIARSKARPWTVAHVGVDDRPRCEAIDAP